MGQSAVRLFLDWGGCMFVFCCCCFGQRNKTGLQYQKYVDCWNSCVSISWLEILKCREIEIEEFNVLYKTSRLNWIKSSAKTGKRVIYRVVNLIEYNKTAFGCLARVHGYIYFFFLLWRKQMIWLIRYKLSLLTTTDYLMHVMQKMSENENNCWQADLNSKQSNWTSNAHF